MTTIATELSNTIINTYLCEKCNYSTIRKTDYIKHLSTKKHLATNLSHNKEITCLICKKTYLNRSGLWRHKQKCKLIECLNNKQEQSQKEELKLKIILIIEMLKHNNEFKGILQKQIQKIQYNQQEDLNNKEFILKKLDLLSDMLFENSEFINLLKNQLEIIEILIKNNKIKELL